jgi:hypothetical protein
MGDYAGKNNIKILFFSYLFTKFLSAYMENTRNGEKVLKFLISCLDIEQHERKF